MDSKQYPTNYPADAVAILDSMSVTEGKGVELVGSMSLRSQQYAGDYDANDIVELKYQTSEEALNHLASEFRESIRRTSKLPNAYIGDIKCGEVAEWRVFGEDTRVHKGKVVGYSAETSRSKVRQLRRSQIITPTEEKEALALLPTKPTPLQLVKAKDSIKFHIVRWSVAEVLEGDSRIAFRRHSHIWSWSRVEERIKRERKAPNALHALALITFQFKTSERPNMPASSVGN